MPTIDEVVSRGMCSGCGGCSVATGGRIPVTIGRYGTRQADVSGADEATRRLGSRVCPFADESPDEDTVAAERFAELDHDPRTGYHRAIAAGRMADDTSVTDSSSGGLTTWVAREALRAGLVDGVIHAGPVADELVGYVVSRTEDELMGRRKSQYYPTSFADAMLSIRGDGRRYAVIGVPCFITAARHVAREDEVLREQISLHIGLVCGHLKSRAYAELLGWQSGVHPDQLASVDFRVKRPGHDAGDYAFGATSTAGRTVTKRNRDLVGANWGHAMMQLGACDFCDDVFAETADVVLGDAWLDRYRKDWRGTNVVITREARIAELISAGAERGEIVLDPLTLDEAATTQAGNFRHRWDGMSVRLEDDAAAGLWVPRKRIAPGSRDVTEGRKRIIRQRRTISQQSHVLFEEARQRDDLRHYLRGIKRHVDRYLEYEFGPILGRAMAAFPGLTRSRLIRGPILRALRRAAGRIRGGAPADRSRSS